MKVFMGDFPSEETDREEQEISVEIHDYDTWGADHTLAHIIYPLLIRLKELKHGSPCVDMTDVPEHLRVDDPSRKEFWNGDIDEHWHARWDYVLDEMIWAFDEHRKDDGMLEDQAYRDRKTNAFRLFGKYYESLWW